jgi:hypothetical protein
MAESPAWPFAPADAFDAPDEIARAFARLFVGADAERALGHLRAQTIERRTAPDLPEAALRHLEGQRSVVAAIESLIARGRR